MFVDSHAHLHGPWFKAEELPQLIERAKQHQVDLIINCASHPNSFSEVINSASYREIEVTLGIQPTYVKEYPDASALREQDLSSIVAIGEIGLDYYWIKDERERGLQELLFRDCLDLANEHDLPVVIHSRKAESACLDILEDMAQTPVLLHSFDGNLKEIERAKDLGYLITVPTIVTRRKNRRKVAQRAGLDHIMLETDAPFCTVDDGIERNEPMYIKEAATYLTKILEVELEDLAKVTSRNARTFHGL
ncbi:MAG: TatD family hydrolase [Candidatus Kariarchaeaceae archaeon]|jgi:TatD DNase family protein